MLLEIERLRTNSPTLKLKKIICRILPIEKLSPISRKATLSIHIR
jgi:hypothetical protein